MSRLPRFRQADVKRAVKGVLECGVPVAGVKIRDGEIYVIVGDPEQPDLATPLDRWMAENAG